MIDSVESSCLSPVDESSLSLLIKELNEQIARYDEKDAPTFQEVKEFYDFVANVKHQILPFMERLDKETQYLVLCRISPCTLRFELEHFFGHPRV